MIEYDVLGQIGLDNCVAARVCTGTANHHLLLDAGGDCLQQLRRPQVYATIGVLFSHFHFDHYAGFDELLRAVWNRNGPLLQVIGPPGTCQVLQHRLQGYLWNNAPGQPGGFRVSEFDGQTLQTIRLLTTEKFEIAHAEPVVETSSLVWEHDDFAVHAIQLDHGTPSIGYRIQEPDSVSVQENQLAEMGLRRGPWLKSLKDSRFPDTDTVNVEGIPYELGQLRQSLLLKKRGTSLGYLTDFRADDQAVRHQLRQVFFELDVLICENNYRNDERELAVQNHHLTASEVGRLALELQPQDLVLFHVSDRYYGQELLDQLEEVRVHYPRARFPQDWQKKIERQCQRAKIQETDSARSTGSAAGDIVD